MEPENEKGLNGKTVAGLTIAALILIIWCIFAAGRFPTWLDEGLYNYKGWAFVTGHFNAYENIWTEYPPLAFFPLGWAQALLGPSILVGRIFGALFFLIGAAFCALTAYRLRGAFAALLALAFMATHIFSSSYYCTGTPYSLSMALCAASCFFLADRKRRKIDSALAAGLAMCAALTLSTMTLFWIGTVVLIFLDRPKSHLPYVFAASITVACLVLAPFADRLFELLWVFSPGKVYEGLQTAYGVKNPFRPGIEFSLALRFILIYLPFAVIGAGALFSSKSTDNGSDTHRKAFCLWAGVLFLFMVLVNAYGNELTWRAHYARYAIYFLPLAIIWAAVTGERLFRTHKKTMIVLMTGAMALSALMAMPLWNSALDDNETDLQRIRKVATEIAKYTKPQDRVFAYGTPYFLLEAKRFGFAQLVNREYTMAFGKQESLVNQRHFYTPEMMFQWFLQEADAVVVDSFAHMPFISPLADRTLRSLNEHLDREFVLMSTVENGDIAKNQAGPVKIYTRKKEMDHGISDP